MIQMNMIEELRADRKPVVDQCKVFNFTVKNSKGVPVDQVSGPCTRIDGELCAAYAYPDTRWRLGNCPLATHIIGEAEQQKKVNPIKASKKAARKRR